MDIKLVSGESARTIRQTLKYPAAIETYYRGWKALFSTAKEDLIIAKQMFEETILLEPESSLGYAMTAWALWWLVVRGLNHDGPHSLQRATELAERAMNLNDITGLPHLMLAQIYLLKNDRARALAEADQAVLARPSCDGSFVAKAMFSIIWAGRLRRLNSPNSPCGLRRFTPSIIRPSFGS